MIAGRSYDPIHTPYGLRNDQFRPLFRSDEEMRAGVRSIMSLSEWGSEHIRQYMALNGYELDEDVVAMITSRLKRGSSLGQIAVLANVLRTSTEPSDDAGAT